jgi:hypothetical protein
MSSGGKKGSKEEVSLSAGRIKKSVHNEENSCVDNLRTTRKASIGIERKRTDSSTGDIYRDTQ